jgi:hypothetical protein
VKIHQKSKGDTLTTAEKFIGGMGAGFMTGIIVKTIRKVLNDSIKTVRPGQLLEAIRKNTSIWGAASGDITRMADRIPKSFIDAGRPMYQKACQESGSSTQLVLNWLKEDNPVLFSLIINTDGGVEWFERQVTELTKNLGLE